MGYSKPQITSEHIDQIRRLIAENPQWHRTRLSQELCKLWDWRGENGQIKDISARDMLRSMEAAGEIILPELLKRSRSVGSSDKIIMQKHDITPLSQSLTEIMPLRVEIADAKDSVAIFKSYISQFHYLGFDRCIGENMKYAIYSHQGVPLSSLMFGASAWACQPRDKFIGWSSNQRQEKLRFTSNNSRFLIYPWIHVPSLASHILSLISHRISNDWESKYGHPVFMLETYVERGRFRGTCYKAANWVNVGKTAGRGRNDRQKAKALPEKDVYLLPLCRRWQKHLTAGA